MNEAWEKPQKNLCATLWEGWYGGLTLWQPTAEPNTNLTNPGGRRPVRAEP